MNTRDGVLISLDQEVARAHFWVLQNYYDTAALFINAITSNVIPQGTQFMGGSGVLVLL